MSTSPGHVHGFLCPESDHTGRHHDGTTFGRMLSRARDDNARDYPSCAGRRYVGKHRAEVTA